MDWVLAWPLVMIALIVQLDFDPVILVYCALFFEVTTLHIQEFEASSSKFLGKESNRTL
jgi:hypothetical protein